MDRRELLKRAAGGVVPLLAAETLGEDGKAAAVAAVPGRAGRWLKAAFEPGDFVMAYYLRDPQPEDGRPPLPGDPFGSADSGGPSPTGDPFAPAGKAAAGSGGASAAEAISRARNLTHRLLNPELDVAAVISRMKKQARVAEKDAAELVTALLDSPERLNMKDCYEPRHLVVFYDGLGVPKAVVEVCFSCESYRILPRDDPHSPYTGDLLAAARLFDKLGMPIGEGISSLKEYEKSLKESRARLQETLKESAAEAEAEAAAKKK